MKGSPNHLPTHTAASPASIEPTAAPASAMQGSSEAGVVTKNSRFRQANKEALLTLGLYAAYFVWWYAFAYGLGSGDPANYSYVFGFPAWFFYSCIAGYPILTLALWLVLRYCFKDMPLDDIPPPRAETSSEWHDTAAAVERSSGPVI